MYTIQIQYMQVHNEMTGLCIVGWEPGKLPFPQQRAVRINPIGTQLLFS